jgi:hypothetical protein
MKSGVPKRLLVGRRIVDVRQEWVEHDDGVPGNAKRRAVMSITLDNGAQLRFGTMELGHDYATELVYDPPPGGGA